MVRGGEDEERWAEAPPTAGFDGFDLLDRVLDVLRSDCHRVRQTAARLYWKIYGGRPEAPSKGFRRSRHKERVAVAFAVCNTLAEEGMPRPVRYVTELCGLTSALPLLHLTKSLRLGEDEISGMTPSEHTLLEPSPQEYVDTFCAHLGIPFHVAGLIRERVGRLQWELFGRSPSVLVAAAATAVLRELGELSPERSRTLCSELDCSPETVEHCLRSRPPVV